MNSGKAQRHEKLCKCGCGQAVAKGDWVYTHHLRKVIRTPEWSARISEGKKRNHPMKGKTYAEYYGKEKAESIKAVQRISGTHDNRPTKGKTVDVYYGKEGADAWHKNMNDGVAISILAGTYGQRRYISHVNNIRCESSFEVKFVEHILFYKSTEYEVCRSMYRLRYVDEYGKRRSYYPDFVLLYKGVVCAVVEVKPELWLQSAYDIHRKKHRNERKMGSLFSFCEEHALTACIYTEKLFKSANPEPSSLNSLISQMHERFERYVNEKVQRLDVADKDSNNTSVGTVLDSCTDTDVPKPPPPISI